jgi:type IV pilus biogenesis protein CpaD/CtpE
MRANLCVVLAAAGAMLTGCSSPKNSDPATPSQAAATADEARITQFYATATQVARGEKTLLCYGVENAGSVWLDPGHRELSAALSRCIEVTPTEDTTYVLSAQSPGGKPVTRELKVATGAARVRLVNVNISALEVKAGDLVSVCYTVENARSVTIEPLKHRGGADPKGCATDTPRKSTTYTITANGAGGETDSERVTVRVK